MTCFVGELPRWVDVWCFALPLQARRLGDFVARALHNLLVARHTVGRTHMKRAATKRRVVNCEAPNHPTRRRSPGILFHFLFTASTL